MLKESKFILRVSSVRIKRLFMFCCNFKLGFKRFPDCWLLQLMDTCISTTWIHKKEESAHWWSSTGNTHTLTHYCQGTELSVGHPDFLIIDFRLDGSAEPSNEILEQGSHDRPLVAQTYSAAVTKGISHAWFYMLQMQIFCATLRVVSIVTASEGGNIKDPTQK